MVNSPKRLVFGVDPGLSGAMCGVYEPRKIIYAENLPLMAVRRLGKTKKVFDYRQFSNFLEFQLTPKVGAGPAEGPRDLSLVEFVVEEPLAIPRMSKRSIASIWDCYGKIVGILAAANPKSITIVEPHEWQLLYQLVPKSLRLEGKARSMWLAKKLYGREAKNDGQADALLMAWWLLYSK